MVVLIPAVGIGTGLLGWWSAGLVGAGYGWRAGRPAWRESALAVPAGWAGWLVVRAFFEPVALVAGVASSLSGLPLPVFLLAILAFGSLIGAGSAWSGGLARHMWERRRGGAGAESG